MGVHHPPPFIATMNFAEYGTKNPILIAPAHEKCYIANSDSARAEHALLNLFMPRMN